MFTGIVEETGIVEAVTPSKKSIALAVSCGICARGIRAGDSLAVNGCCLTVTRRTAKLKRTLLHFDLLQETWRRTNLQFARPGSGVNLERSLSASGRFDGHFVTGHIDSLGTITRWGQRNADWLLEIAAPPEVLRHVVFKGSIAVDGISLTIAAIRKRGFQIWIIPHTYEVTALRERCVGDAVNLEADILSKYVENSLRHRSRHSGKGKVIS